MTNELSLTTFQVLVRDERRGEDERGSAHQLELRIGAGAVLDHLEDEQPAVDGRAGAIVIGGLKESK